ncbi:MAG TPA: hypothetical protein DD405_02795 [Desulfobacteraceae bacterium]|nr:hypothetical protein [Desulfobacteraceae bacterium]
MNPCQAMIIRIDKYFFLLIFLLFPLFSVCADTIFLKNGNEIKNVRAWEEDGLIKCFQYGSIVAYQKKDVVRIEKGLVKKSSNPPLLWKGGYGYGDKPEFFKVIRVFDGDSFIASYKKIKIGIRIIGIDAPETGKKKGKGQPFGKEAGKYLKKMIKGKTVAIKSYGTDRYNRQLAEVFVGNVNLGFEMIKAGLAEVYNRKRLPKGFDVRQYLRAEKRAKKYHRGIWSLGDKYISPKIWRKKNRVTYKTR